MTLRFGLARLSFKRIGTLPKGGIKLLRHPLDPGCVAFLVRLRIGHAPPSAVEWGKADREKARETISSDQLPASLRSAAAVGLFGALALTSSDEDVQWVEAWVSSIKDEPLVKSLGFEISKSWIATGILSPERYVGWANGITGAKMADWGQNLEAAARVADEFQKRGKLEKSELLDLSDSIARSILSLDDGLTTDQEGSPSPYSKIQTKKSQAFCRLGEMAGRIYGVAKFSDYRFPADEIAASSYAT